LETALTIANEFLEKGQLILYTEGRAVNRTDDIANGAGILKNIPLAILIDESSASASEIVSGAMQDWDRGTIIGRRSFGKGLVQQEFPLQDGGRLRLTIARYHTPSGRVIQSPYENGEADKYYENVIKRYLSDERFNKDSIKINDSLKFKTLKKGRIVYGGGGIIPDVFMPLDTSFYSKSYIKCVNKGVLTDFVNIYTDNHRKEFDAKYKNMEQFAKDYQVPDSYWNEFLAYSKSHGVEFSEADLKTSGAEIRKNLKGLIVRALYGLDGYLKYDYATDPEVQKALEVLK
jgi:carboxyl-terminal processing protease